MSEALTIHVVQTFIEIDGCPVAEEPVACQSASQAKAKAQAARGSKLGVTAWSRTSPDPGLGDWGGALRSLRGRARSLMNSKSPRAVV